MIANPTRHIYKSAWQSRDEVRELLQGIFIAELLRPSRCLWVISPWISDIAVVDNRVGTFNAINPSWGPRQVRLIEILGHLLQVGTVIRLATRPGAHNEQFIGRMRSIANRLELAQEVFGITQTEDLHEKGLLGDDFYLSGSMNLTYNGVELLEEAVKYDTDPGVIGEARLTYFQRWGGRLPSAPSP